MTKATVTDTDIKGSVMIEVNFRERFNFSKRANDDWTLDYITASKSSKYHISNARVKQILNRAMDTFDIGKKEYTVDITTGKYPFFKLKKSFLGKKGVRYCADNIET